MIHSASKRLLSLSMAALLCIAAPAANAQDTRIQGSSNFATTAPPTRPGIVYVPLPLSIVEGGRGTEDVSVCIPASSIRCEEFADLCTNDGCGAGSEGGGVSCSCAD